MSGQRAVWTSTVGLWLPSFLGFAQTESPTAEALGPAQAFLILGILVLVLGGLILMEWVRRAGPAAAGRAAGERRERTAPEHERKEAAVAAIASVTERNFLRAVVAGFIATYTFTMAGFWEVGVGLPRVDVAGLLSANGGFGYAWGQVAHFLNGIILSLIYAFWLYRWLPGPRLIKGIVYGILTAVAAALVVVPLVSAGTPEPTGIFFVKTSITGQMILAAFVVHLVYGIALGLAYRPTEETVGEPTG